MDDILKLHEDDDDSEENNYGHCMNCGIREHYYFLDSKPMWMTGIWVQLCWLLGDKFQMWLLRRAADRGEDFDRIECFQCYGPSFDNLVDFGG